MKNHKPTLKLPRKIILLGEIYDIKFTELPEKDLGEIDYDDKVIKLSLSIKNKPGELEYVFYHELGHYLSHLVGIEDGEVFASLYSNFLISILKQIDGEMK